MEKRLYDLHSLSDEELERWIRAVWQATKDSYAGHSNAVAVDAANDQLFLLAMASYKMERLFRGNPVPRSPDF